MEIRIKQIRKNFGEKTAVDIDEYHIHSGELLGLVGNNGAGKTTLFRLMLDLTEACLGQLFLGKELVGQSEAWKRFTGAYIDNSFLIDYLTPEEYFEFVGQMYGLSRATVNQRVEAMREFTKGEILGQQKLIRNLSSGNQQKVGIIAALLHQPEIVILDEPFNFLDPSSQIMLKHLLQEYNRQTGATLLVSSHNLDHTINLCPRIALMENGRIIRDLHQQNGHLKEELEHYFNEPS